MGRKEKLKWALNQILLFYFVCKSLVRPLCGNYSVVVASFIMKSLISRKREMQVFLILFIIRLAF